MFKGCVRFATETEDAEAFYRINWFPSAKGPVLTLHNGLQDLCVLSLVSSRVLTEERRDKSVSKVLMTVS